MADGFLSDEEIEKLERAQKKSPSDERAAFAKSQPMDLLKTFKETGHKTQAPEFLRDAWNAAIGAVDQGSLENLRYSPGFRQALEGAQSESPASTTVGQGIGLAGVTGASLLVPGGPVVRGMELGPLVAAALQGGLTKPEGSEGLDLGVRAKQAAAGPLISGAIRGAGAGLKGVGDRAMQLATGSRYTKGMGTRMADEGLWGTKGMMRGQINRNLPKREAELTDAARQVTGMVRPGGVGRAIRSEADQYIPQSPSGRNINIPSENQPFVDLAQQRSVEAMLRGSLNPQEAISTARTVAKPAYNKAGAPLDAFKHKLSQTEAIALKDAVKDLADAQGIPGVRKALASEQALIEARTGLNRPESLSSAAAKTVTRGALGIGAGIPGGIPGMLVGAAASTPIGLSTIGQGATRLGRKAPLAVPASIAGATNAAPGGDGKPEFLSDEEMEAIEASNSNSSDSRAASAARVFGTKAKDILPGIDEPGDQEKNKKATEAHKKVAPTLYGRKRKK